MDCESPGRVMDCEPPGSQQDQDWPPCRTAPQVDQVPQHRAWLALPPISFLLQIPMFAAVSLLLFGPEHTLHDEKVSDVKIKGQYQLPETRSRSLAARCQQTCNEDQVDVCAWCSQGRVPSGGFPESRPRPLRPPWIWTIGMKKKNEWWEHFTAILTSSLQFTVKLPAGEVFKKKCDQWTAVSVVALFFDVVSPTGPMWKCPESV